MTVDREGLRPWIAALLALLFTGLGHLYLRRWRRAAGWLVALLAATVLLVPPESVEAFAAGEQVSPLTLAPTLLLSVLSVVDAYRIGASSRADGAAESEPESVVRCPRCGREREADVPFCEWCAERTPDDR